MESIDLQRRITLLEATLREILRIDTDAMNATDGSMGMDLALDGRLLKEWRLIKARAEGLLRSA